MAAYQGTPPRIPGINALIAFETAARHGNLSRAAKELRTTHSVVSRHMANLEEQLSARLFERSRAGVRLTDAGSRFRDAVATSLDTLRAAITEISERPHEEQVVIACSHDGSHFFLMPRYGALLEALGQHVRIRILTYHYVLQPLSLDPAADMVLTWEANPTGKDRVLIPGEAVRPVCSPGYAASHAGVLNGPVGGWGGLTFLDLTLTNQGWASWEDWFGAAGRPASAPRYIGLDSYTYVLEAAIAGQGIALGWRGFYERYLDTGSLIEITGGFVELDNRYCAVLTEKGQRNPLARKCLERLGELSWYPPENTAAA